MKKLQNIKEKLAELKGERDEITVTKTLTDFSQKLIELNKNTSKNVENLNDTINHLNPTDISRTLNPIHVWGT